MRAAAFGQLCCLLQWRHTSVKSEQVSLIVSYGPELLVLAPLLGSNSHSQPRLQFTLLDLQDGVDEL